MENIEIHVSNVATFSTELLSKEFRVDLRKSFRFTNPDYNSEVNNGEVQYIFLSSFNRGTQTMTVPRGSINFIEKVLTREAKRQKITISKIDERLSRPLKYSLPQIKPEFQLRHYQQKIVDIGYRSQQGLFVSPCGSGKTIAAIALMQRCQQHSLVIVPDNEILKQWIERLVQSTGISPYRIGILTSKSITINDIPLEHKVKSITIATNASLFKKVSDKSFCEQFGFVVLDEAHLVGARTFREVMNSFPAKYRFGFTATDYRNDGLSDFLTMFCGDKLYEVTDDDLIEAGQLIKPHLEVVTTDFSYDYNYNYRAAWNYMLKSMASNRQRNLEIVDLVRKEYEEKRMVLIVAKLVDHCKKLEALLKQRIKGIRVGVMAGEKYDTATVESAREGNIDVILSVDRAKMGLDIKPLETVILVAPRNAQNEIEQIVGRVARPDTCFGKYEDKADKYAKVIDMFDSNVISITGSNVMKSVFKNRYAVYVKKCYLDDFDINEFFEELRNNKPIKREANRNRW